MLQDQSSISFGRPYRAVRLGSNGSVEGVDLIRARTDDEAKALAEKIVNGYGIDLWDQSRYLDSFPPLRVNAPGAKA